MIELIMTMLVLFSLLLWMSSICDEDEHNCDKTQCGTCPFPCAGHEERSNMND